MRKDSYPLEDNFLLRLQRGSRIANLQHRRASIYRTHKGSGSHEPSLVKQLLGLVVVSFLVASCGANARIANETPTGGTVLYSYIEEQEVLTSPGRKDALRLLGEKCPAGYRISREGQIAQIDQAVDRAWMGQVSRDGQASREKRWAIQFVCK